MHVDETTASQAEVLDLLHLESQTMGDVELAAELLALFESQCGRLVPAIGAGGDPHALSDAAHTLRGGAAAVGARQIWAACRDIEEQLAETGGPVAAELLTRLADSRAAFEVALARWRRAA